MSTITSVAGVVAGSVDGASVTTSAINTTGANLIVISVSSYAAAAPTDSKSNTWNGLTANVNPGLDTNRLFYCINPTVGAGHTFTVNTVASFPVISVVAASSPGGFWSVGDETGNTALATTIQPGSLSPQLVNSLLVTGVSSNGSAPDVNSGFTKFSIASVGGQRCSGGIGYKIVTDNSLTNPTWDVFGVQSCSSSMADFYSIGLPVITTNGGGPTASVSVVEGNDSVTTVDGSNDDGGDLSFSITGGADAELFNIGEENGGLNFLIPPDYEIPTDANADNVYVVIVTAANDVGADSQTISVTVTNNTADDANRRCNPQLTLIFGLTLYG